MVNGRDGIEPHIVKATNIVNTNQAASVTLGNVQSFIALWGLGYKK